jgi:hypothetical protein
MRVIKYPGHTYGGFSSVLFRTRVWHWRGCSSIGDFHDYSRIRDIYGYSWIGDFYDCSWTGDFRDCSRIGDGHGYSRIRDIHSCSGFGDGDRYASGNFEAREVFGWLGVVDTEAAANESTSIEIHLHWTLIVTASRIVHVILSGGTSSFRTFEFSCTMSTLTIT